MRQPRPFVKEAHNLWLGLWPFQFPIFVALILVGISHRDDRFLISGSPFLLPYATTSNLLGLWLGMSCFLKDWQAALLWLFWWGAVVIRGLYSR